MEGFDKAYRYVKRLRATDKRFAFFFAHPWLDRLRKEGNEKGMALIKAL